MLAILKKMSDIINTMIDKISIIKAACDGKLTSTDLLRLERKGMVKFYTVRRCGGYVSKKEKEHPVFIAKPRKASNSMLCFQAADKHLTSHQYKVYYNFNF